MRKDCVVHDEENQTESDVLNELSEPAAKEGEWWGWYRARYLQAIVLFLGMAVNYLMRVNLSMAIVVMTDRNATSHHHFQTFDWSSKEKGILLSCFFVGYSVTNFFAGVLSTRVSNKLLLLGSVAYSSAATLLTPLLVHWWGFYALLVLRITMGVMQAMLMPVVHGQLSRWAPPNERARIGTIVLGGIHFGTVVMFISSGLLAQSRGGWPSIFYMSGGLALLWCLLWAAYGAERPADFRLISQQERKYIESSLAHNSSQDKKTLIPWSKILTNKACYALALVSVSHNWGFWTLMTQMPTYFNSVLKYDISSNGWITALPYFTQWIMSLAMSFVADFLIRKEITSITSSRKLCNTVGHWGVAIALLLLGYTTDDLTAICMYTVAVTVLGFTFMGYNINHLDLCPNFASLLMGLTNGLGNVASLFGPLYVGFVVSDSTSILEWRTVFNTSALVFFVGNLIFIIFGAGKVQEFNNIHMSTSNENQTPAEKEQQTEDLEKR